MMIDHNLKNGRINKCQVCGKKNLKQIINLGNQPPCDSLLDTKDYFNNEEKFPLNFVYCDNCILGQIDFVVPQEKLFYLNYPYRSGITKTLVEKLFSTSESFVSKFKNFKNKFCIDIGSNDGTLLKGFKRYGFNVLGIEPTNISEIANKDGIETLKSFFNEKLGNEIVDNYGYADVVTATNVFAHIPNMKTLMLGIDKILDEKGIFISESHYLFDLLNKLQYDSIYHEHLKYYSLNSLKKFFDFYNFEIIDIEFIKNYGGSIRVFASRKGNYDIKKNVIECLENEIKIINSELDLFTSFTKKIKKNKFELIQLIKSYTDAGKRVIGIGCPGRCSTLINYCEINLQMMDYIAEQSSSLKLNKFLPGMHIPIKDEKEMFKNPPDLAILLSWHYSDEIIGILRKKGFKSRIVVPLPEIKVVDC
tara:strand:- start:34295 stop:35554 length:1260 start_codon:yes stop_codon:yes gene_type:complete